MLHLSAWASTPIPQKLLSMKDLKTV
jgi:hypothetical protein